MSTFSRYNRGGSIDKQHRYKIEKLSDFGWFDTGETVDGVRPIFRLDNGAELYRESGGCVVDAGGGMIMFFPATVTFAKVTEWARKMAAIPFEGEPGCPGPMLEADSYGLEARG